MKFGSFLREENLFAVHISYVALPLIADQDERHNKVSKCEGTEELSILSIKWTLYRTEERQVTR